jgi:P-type conjugative transfer protein TrbJ
MRCNRKHLAVAIFVLASAAFVRPAAAQYVVTCTNCSTTITQALQWAQQVQQFEQQVQQYATQLRQYALELQNAATVPQQIYSSAMSDMQQVQSLMSSGSQLSFSNPGASIGTFSSFLNSTSGNLGNLTSQAAQYATWSTQAKDGIQAAMNAVAAQNSQLSTDNTTMTKLQSQAASATGQMQAIQNAAEISAQDVRETEKLRQLIMVQTQLQANQAAIQNEQDSQAQAQWQNFVNVGTLSDTGNGY